MDPANQLEEGVAGGDGRALQAGRAGRDMGLDDSVYLTTQGAQGERRQLLDAGMNFGDRHWPSPWKGRTWFSPLREVHGAIEFYHESDKIPEKT
jgi:hypothetical protein